MDDDKRVTRLLKNADRKDRIEQKLGIDRALTKLRDERALREMDRLNRRKKR